MPEISRTTESAYPTSRDSTVSLRHLRLHSPAPDGRRAGHQQRRRRLRPRLASRLRENYSASRRRHPLRICASPDGWHCRDPHARSGDTASTHGSRFLRNLGFTALILVIAQAVLGGMRVLFHNPALTATIHAILAQIFFITVVSLSLFTSQWWNSDPAEARRSQLTAVAHAISRSPRQQSSCS